MRIPCSLLFILISVLSVSRAFAQTLEEAVAVAPLIEPQADGVLYLNSEAAALVKWIEKQDVLVISPARNVFIDRLEVSFAIPTQSTGDVELRYTLDGRDPTIESALFQKPLIIDQTTLVRVRPFRKGLKQTPWAFNGMDSGKTVSAVFRKKALKPVIKEALPGPIRLASPASMLLAKVLNFSSSHLYFLETCAAV